MNLHNNDTALRLLANTTCGEARPGIPGDPRFFVDEGLMINLAMTDDEGRFASRTVRHLTDCCNDCILEALSERLYELREEGWDLRNKDMIRIRRKLQAFLCQF